MFSTIAVSRIAYHPDRRSEILYAEVTFYGHDGTKFMSMNISAKHLPSDIKEGKQIYFTMQPPPKESGT